VAVESKNQGILKRGCLETVQGIIVFELFEGYQKDGICPDGLACFTP